MTHRRIPRAVLQNYLENTKKALEDEDLELRRFGPAFDGDYDSLDPLTHVLGAMTVCLDGLRKQADIYRKDFMQLFGILALCEDEDAECAKELKERSCSAYIAAENRLQGQARAFGLIARKYGRPEFTKGLEDYCKLPWDKVDEITKSAREANRQAEEAEAELERFQAESGDGSGREPAVAVEEPAQSDDEGEGGAVDTGCVGEDDADGDVGDGAPSGPGGRD